MATTATMASATTSVTTSVNPDPYADIDENFANVMNGFESNFHWSLDHLPLKLCTTKNSPEEDFDLLALCKETGSSTWNSAPTPVRTFVLSHLPFLMDLIPLFPRISI